MILLFVLLVCACGIAASAVALALRKVTSPKNVHPVTPQWIEELSVDRYRPMLRLLDPRDQAYLGSRPGIRPEQLAEFRSQRSQVFREYLSQLHADFACVCMALKIVMLQSAVDRPDLASALLRSQIRFATRMVWIQAGLLLYELGIGSVDVSALLNLFDGMRLELRALVPESAVWGS